jgi:predicted TIM-barrel fold metal-dependent hydrolase
MTGLSNSLNRNEGSGRASRRDFLSATLVGVGTCALANVPLHPEGETEKTDVGIIDAHVHVWTPDTKRYPLAKGFRKEKMKPKSFTPKEFLAHCRPAGVKRVVLIQMSFYGFDNSYMLDVVREHKGVFSAVAVIDESEKPQQRMQQLAAKGVRGFRIRPGKRSPETWLDSDGMKAMWAQAAKSGQQICPLINPAHLPSIDRMCRRYPQTPVVIDHFARIGIDGKLPDKQLDRLCRLSRHRKVRVKVSAYYALGKKKAPYRDLLPMIRRLLDAFGPERLMWASDCPFQVAGGHDYASSVDLIRKHAEFLSTSDRDWILRKTAEKAFF